MTPILIYFFEKYFVSLDVIYTVHQIKAMKIINCIRLFIILFSLLIAATNTEDEIYIDENILGEARKIPTEKLLKYERIVDAIHDQADKTRFYLIMAMEIERRIKDLDHKFYSQKIFYIDKINEYEHDLNLPIHSLDMIQVDLDDIPVLSTQQPVYGDYYQNKKRIQLASLIYIQKNTAYHAPLNIYRNYFLALDQLYHCITLNDFRAGVESYDAAVKKIP